MIIDSNNKAPERHDLTIEINKTNDQKWYENVLLKKIKTDSKSMTKIFVPFKIIFVFMFR